VADNRRSSARHDVSLSAYLAMDGTQHACTVVNLSLGGAQVAIGSRLPMGTRAQISFAVPTIDESIEVGSTVRWSNDQATGLQFDGLRARDVWALNKYFEQLQASG
jgi:hypothetical protein